MAGGEREKKKKEYIKIYIIKKQSYIFKQRIRKKRKKKAKEKNKQNW